MRKSEDIITHAKYAESEDFKNLCSAAGMPATKRQAGKYRRKMGKVWKFHHAGK